MIPCSRVFDQQTLTCMLEHDPVVQRYRALLALFDWTVVPAPARTPAQPGRRPHPPSAYIKAFLLKLEEDLTTCRPASTNGTGNNEKNILFRVFCARLAPQAYEEEMMQSVQ